MSQVYCIRRKKGKHLTSVERRELEYLVKKNHTAPKKKKKTQSELAKIMGVSPATMSRELKRPDLKIGKDHELAEQIESKILEEKYSPDAVIMEITRGKYEFNTSICTRRCSPEKGL